MLDGGVRVDELVVPDRLLQAPESKRCEVLADFLSDELEEVDHELRLATEAFTKNRVLGGDADGAGVEVADAHHDAAGDDQRRRGEAEFFRTEQRTDDDVASGLQLAVDLNDDTVPHAVQHERLLGLGQAELPRGSGVFQ